MAQVSKRPPARRPAGATAAAAKASPGAEPTETISRRELGDLRGQIKAIGTAMAVIEFALDGTIINANENFASSLGYPLGELINRPHGMLVDPAYRASDEYRQFWDNLRLGKFQTGEFRRIHKSGRDVWIQASYSPIAGDDGKPYKVVKYASDITDHKLRSADYEGQLAAIDRSQAVISFRPDGTILTANENFQTALGYPEAELKGQHHRMLVLPEVRESREYRAFWADLAAGRAQSGEFCRLGKGGNKVWIQATYSPICDAAGKPYKIVKYASDITKMKLRTADYEGQLQAISKSQAVIEFALDGTIQTANENFLRSLGYTIEEIRGQHHGMFVPEEYRRSTEYRQFWADLNLGRVQAGEFCRIGRGGRRVWIQASYNPIFDPNGKPYKVVKYAADVTAAKEAEAAATKRFEETSNKLRDASNQLTSVADQVASGATQTATQAGRVADAAEMMKGNVAQVASASEEMSATVKEIAANAGESAKTARTAKGLASESNQTVQALSVGALAIGKVTKVISTIAQQTNLLALNATIEAARAGEAGKGFAVVANEVKELAKQTARATEEISAQIETIQSDTSRSVQAIGTMSGIIDQIDGFASSIAASVQEQAAAVREIARNANEVSAGVGNVVDSIGGVASAARDAERTAAMTQKATLNVNEVATDLHALFAR